MSVENPSKHRTLDRRKILFVGTALTAASALGTGTLLRTAPAQAAGQLNPQPLPPSPGWTRALPPGPDLRVKITEEYAKHVARDAFFWAWPLVNIYNKRRGAEQSKELAYAGPVPSAPLNRIVMLTDYVAADERIVACPNQDVVYGGGSLGLEQSPVVIQVPDFGDRFWVYQAVDLRSDSFVQLGKMYGTTPGFYLLVGPNWRGDVPKGIRPGLPRLDQHRLHCAAHLHGRHARGPQGDPAGAAADHDVPAGEYDGRMKSIDWSTIKKLPNAATGEQEIKWVPPEAFVDTLPAVLADAPPLPGEEARYAQVLAVLEAARSDPKLKAAMTQAAAEADEKLVKPLFEFRNYGQQLPHHWSTISNEAAFGTDYFTRTAVAKSNIFVNAPNETKYFYQDLDASGARLNGRNRYTVTFAKDQTPPVHGFWSLTLYNEHHFFAPNEINRYSLGTKNKTLKYDADGSLTLYVQADPPPQTQRDNWLPAPKGSDFSLYVRAYWPKTAVTEGSWTPPAVVRVD